MTERTLPIGIEIECSWRSYFPDLWVDGLPNIDEATLARITAECNEREKILLPRLHETIELGVPRGADRYWEFAFDPVTTIGITCDQAIILQAQGLIPRDHYHALHITFGGLNLTKNAYYMAMVLESMSSSPARIMSAFHPNATDQSKGWGRKGEAGMFLKEGSHDLQHGYETAVEVRILHIKDMYDLYPVLDVAQRIGEMVLKCQNGESCAEWDLIVSACRDVLADHKLPDCNWKKPHVNPEIWRRFADKYDSIQSSLLSKVLPVVFNHV